MQEKLALMQDIINGNELAPSRAQLAERLGRIMVAEYLMHNVQAHILDCNQRGIMNKATGQPFFGCPVAF